MTLKLLNDALGRFHPAFDVFYAEDPKEMGKKLCDYLTTDYSFMKDKVKELLISAEFYDQFLGATPAERPQLLLDNNILIVVLLKHIMEEKGTAKQGGHQLGGLH